jgi:hypothetical protein
MITYFSIAIIFLGLIALLHLIYETILLPSIRLHFRFKVFGLRDQLREIKLKKSNAVNDSLFEDMETSINNAIKILPFVNLHTMKIAADRFHSDKELQKLMEKRKKLIDECPIPEIKKIRNQLFQIVEFVFAFNTAMWFIYLLPVFGVALFFKTIKNTMKALVCVPSQRFDEIVRMEEISSSI